MTNSSRQLKYEQRRNASEEGAGVRSIQARRTVACALKSPFSSRMNPLVVRGGYYTTNGRGELNCFTTSSWLWVTISIIWWSCVWLWSTPRYQGHVKVWTLGYLGIWPGYCYHAIYPGSRCPGSYPGRCAYPGIYMPREYIPYRPHPAWQHIYHTYAKLHGDWPNHVDHTRANTRPCTTQVYTRVNSLSNASLRHTVYYSLRSTPDTHEWP